MIFAGYRVTPAVLGGKTISHKTWIHRVARETVSKPLAKTSVTPSQITALRLVTGVAAAVCFTLGTDRWWDVGAWMFIFSMLLDRADGDFARLTGQTSEWGHKFDLIVDGICNAAIFIGLGVGLRGGEQGLTAIPLGVLAGASVTAVFYLVFRAEKLAGERSGELQSFFGFDVDDAMLFIPLLVLFGFQEGLLLAASLGAPLFAVCYYFWLRAKLQAQARESGSGMIQE